MKTCETCIHCHICYKGKNLWCYKKHFTTEFDRTLLLTNPDIFQNLAETCGEWEDDNDEKETAKI